MRDTVVGCESRLGALLALYPKNNGDRGEPELTLGTGAKPILMKTSAHVHLQFFEATAADPAEDTSAGDSRRCGRWKGRINTRIQRATFTG